MTFWARAVVLLVVVPVAVDSLRLQEGILPSCIYTNQSKDRLPNDAYKAFDDIYSKKFWVEKDKSNSLSGGGSSVNFTKTLCKTLAVAVESASKRKLASTSNPIVRILDAPSGDFCWMPSCLAAIESKLLPGVTLQYQGVDVSAVAVKLANEKREKVQATLKRVTIQSFQHLDLARPGCLKKFGTEPFDVIHSHDALQHNPHSNIREILRNFNQSGLALVVDIDRGERNHKDIQVGGFRPVDITKKPYSHQAECWDENVEQKAFFARENEWFGIFKLPFTERK